MNKYFPYFLFLKIAEECRKELIYDTLSKNSPDLYDALYSNINSEIFPVKIKLYELMWLELHWTKLIEAIEQQKLTYSEKKTIISLFSKWYLRFISEWQYTELDSILIDGKKSILKALISTNNEWNKNIKRMKVSFEQSKKKLN